MVLQDLQRVETTAEWCASTCFDERPPLVRVARTCHDVADVVHLGVRLLARNEYRRHCIGELLIDFLLQTRGELARHSTPPVRELLRAIDRALESVRRTVARLETGNGSGTRRRPRSRPQSGSRPR